MDKQWKDLKTEVQFRPGYDGATQSCLQFCPLAPCGIAAKNCHAGPKRFSKQDNEQKGSKSGSL